jgi:hypothetical protein
MSFWLRDMAGMQSSSEASGDKGDRDRTTQAFEDMNEALEFFRSVLSSRRSTPSLTRLLLMLTLRVAHLGRLLSR